MPGVDIGEPALKTFVALKYLSAHEFIGSAGRGHVVQ